MKGEVKNFFRNLFLRRETRLVDVDGELLIRRFSKEEIKQAVCDCDSSKSPRPDGFIMEFYKESWEITREDLLKVFDEFISTESWLGAATPFTLL